jgi:hypothetical protein
MTHSRSSRIEMFLWGFAVGAAPVFMCSYFPGGGRSFIESVIAAGLVGVLFGILAAVFGQRMLAFFMNLPW